MAKDKNNDSPTVVELLKSKDKVEAMKWLTTAPTGVHRNIGEMTNEDSIRYIAHLYDLGAREIVVVKIGANGRYESTDTLIATLPEKSAARKAVLASEAERLEEMGYEQVADVGQKHLLLWFD